MELFYFQLMIISIIILAFTSSYAVYKIALRRMNTPDKTVGESADSEKSTETASATPMKTRDNTEIKKETENYDNNS